jgi:DNA-binding MarR family transcriptional regulator
MQRGSRPKQEHGNGATSALADACARIVIEAVPPVMQVIREETRRHGDPPFSIPQFRALSFLHRRPGAYLFHLAEHLGVSRPTASALIDRLVTQGMVTRVTDPKERRRILLTLTPLGARRLRQASLSAQVWMAGVLARLPSGSLQRITTGIRLLEEAVRATGRGNGRPEGWESDPRAQFGRQFDEVIATVPPSIAAQEKHSRLGRTQRLARGRIE